MRLQSLTETEQWRQTEAESERLKLALEQRVVERTEKLTAMNDALTQEVTEQKRVEEALRASAERFRRYFTLGLIGLAGWALCGALMAALSWTADPAVALAVHGTVAPLLFAAVAFHYFRAPGAREPLPTALVFVGIVVLLDLAVVV